MQRILILALICAAFSACKTEAKETESAEIYTVTTPLVMDTTITQEYIAQLQSVKNIELRALEKGYLQQILVDEGQFVHAGQPLFRIKPALFQADVQKASAEVRQAEVELQNTKALADKDIVSQSELALAKAKLDAAKAEQSAAKTHLGQTEVRAPFDGVIDRIPLKLGSMIEEGALLTTLSDNKNIYAYFNVSEPEYLNYRMKPDSSKVKNVNLKLANGMLHPSAGIIETVEGEFDRETGNIAFRAKFPNPDLVIKHGETGKILMKVPVAHALIIPQKATYEMQDKIYVYVVDASSRVSSRNITIQYELPNLYIVESGLQPGDKILVDGLQMVKEDQQVKTKQESPQDVISKLQLIN